jgi:2-hydroxy-3-keto-5-methylthiopentenyl-1-phosphate phosphatase
VKLNIFCDFDGTITVDDATRTILEAFAAPEHRQWDLLWERRLISGRERIERQTRLIRARRETLRLVAGHMAIDGGIHELEKACARTGSSLIIVSDGIDLVMEAVLKARGLAHLPHYSNRLSWQDERSPFLTFPFADSGCQGGCGVCQCKLLDEKWLDAPAVYIGNCLSACCVAGRVERLFAKGRLREYCRQKSIHHESFTDLSQVAQALFKDIHPEESRRNCASSSLTK